MTTKAKTSTKPVKTPKKAASKPPTSRGKQPAPSAIPPEALALYDQLVTTNPNIERKGVTLPYTAINGNMFSFMSNTGALALRLPTEARAAFLAKYKTTLFEAHGSVMQEYVLVPDRLLKNTQALQPYLELSYTYAQTLKPKPQKKTKN